MILEFDLETSGGLFLLASVASLFYGPISWLFTRKKEEKIIASWQQKEIWWAAILVAGLCFIGAIDAYSSYLVITVVFVELLLLLLAFLYVNFTRNKSEKNTWTFPKWMYWLFFIGNGLVILGFEDHFGGEDQFAIAILAYSFALLLLVLSWVFQQIRTIINLRNEQKKTELMHLQSQVNPHFFFNMLNNLYGWVEKDTKKAQELILNLSDMMRYSIYEGQKDAVALEDEIAYLKNYIELHRMRYHKKIDIAFNLDIQEAAYQVMPLLFIILLENAFKHGVENLRENAYVKIDMSAQNQEIICSVENNFDPENKPSHTGIGLKNLKRRLELVYPNKHTLSLLKTKAVYKAQLRINLTQ